MVNGKADFSLRLVILQNIITFSRWTFLKREMYCRINYFSSFSSQLDIGQCDNNGKVYFWYNVSVKTPFKWPSLKHFAQKL